MARLSTRIRDLDRASVLVRASVRLARAAAAIETANRIWLPPSSDGQPRPKGTGNYSGDDRSENANWSERISRLSAFTADRGLRFSSPMATMSKLGRAVESGKAVHAIEAARRGAPGLIEKAARSSRIAEGLEAKRPSHLHAELRANLVAGSSVRAMTGLQTLHPREIVQPSSEPNNGNARQEITINSSPTVVINAAAASSSVRYDVIEALRAHREELFDQLKREYARRERAQF